jgi:hypothetical protein
MGVTAGALRVRVLRCRQKALQLRSDMELKGNGTRKSGTEENGLSISLSG